jgi:hypothetical protein
MKLDFTDKLILGYFLAFMGMIVLLLSAWNNEVNKYKAIARFYYHRDVMHEAQKGICSDTPQIDDAKIIKALDITGHRQIQKDMDWVKSEFFNN